MFSCTSRERVGGQFSGSFGLSLLLLPLFSGVRFRDGSRHGLVEHKTLRTHPGIVSARQPLAGRTGFDLEFACA